MISFIPFLCFSPIIIYKIIKKELKMQFKDLKIKLLFILLIISIAIAILYRLAIPFFARPIVIPVENGFVLVLIILFISSLLFILLMKIKKKLMDRKLRLSQIEGINQLNKKWYHKVISKLLELGYKNYLVILALLYKIHIFLSRKFSLYWDLMRLCYKVYSNYTYSWVGMDKSYNYYKWKIMLHLYHLPRRLPTIVLLYEIAVHHQIYYSKFVLMICFFISMLLELGYFWADFYFQFVIVPLIKNENIKRI